MAGERFTPGPWHTAENANGIRSIVERAPGDRICSAFFRGEIQGSAEVAEANARLIAVAPELYDLGMQFASSIEYQIRKDKATGDDEGVRVKMVMLNYVRDILSRAAPAEQSDAGERK